MKKRLMMFYGKECSHCHDMEPLVKKLEKEQKIKIERMEVWHNSKNSSQMIELSHGECIEVPFFFNDNTGKSVCGSTDYKKLKEWALG